MDQVFNFISYNYQNPKRGLDAFNLNESTSWPWIWSYKRLDLAKLVSLRLNEATQPKVVQQRPH
jgi:hypothetical protein